MAKSYSEPWLLPSLIDRLTVDRSKGWPTGGISLRDLKESVRRDLENLLNTRHRAASWPDDYEELERSLYNYGIPDFTSTNASSTVDVRQFLRDIEEVIRLFEPRFKWVRVSLPESVESEDRVLRFRVDGLLHAEPAPEPAAFNTEIEPGAGVFAVKCIA